LPRSLREALRTLRERLHRSILGDRVGVTVDDLPLALLAMKDGSHPAADRHVIGGSPDRYCVARYAHLAGEIGRLDHRDAGEV
jgi:hypothetical protein